MEAGASSSYIQSAFNKLIFSLACFALKAVFFPIPTSEVWAIMTAITLHQCLGKGEGFLFWCHALSIIPSMECCNSLFICSLIHSFISSCSGNKRRGYISKWDLFHMPITSQGDFLCRSISSLSVAPPFTLPFPLHPSFLARRSDWRIYWLVRG